MLLFNVFVGVQQNDDGKFSGITLKYMGQMAFALSEGGEYEGGELPTVEICGIRRQCYVSGPGRIGFGYYMCSNCSYMTNAWPANGYSGDNCVQEENCN